MSKDLRQEVRRLRSRGWTVEKRRKHLRLEHPQGGVVWTGGTPSDHRAIRNLRAQIARVERSHT